MRKKTILSNILLVLGILAALFSGLLAFRGKDAAPGMVKYPADAAAQAEKMMDAICRGDYTAASAAMYGNPGMGTVPENTNLAIELIWTAYLGSMDYEFAGDCYVTDSGVAVDVVVRTLDVPAVIAGMEGYAQELLSRRVAAARDMSDIYDEDNNFRQEILDIVLRDAAVQSLEANQTPKEQTITLNLVYEKGQWWVMPDGALQNILSGSF